MSETVVSEAIVGAESIASSKSCATKLDESTIYFEILKPTLDDNAITDPAPEEHNAPTSTPIKPAQPDHTTNLGLQAKIVPAYDDFSPAPSPGPMLPPPPPPPSVSTTAPQVTQSTRVSKEKMAKAKPTVASLPVEVKKSTEPW